MHAAGAHDGGSAARIVLRPIASPMPLGFLALAGASLVLSGLQLGWLTPQDSRYVALALIAFAVPLELLASVFGFLARDAVAATGMAVLAAGWLAIALVKFAAPPGTTNRALGLLLLFAGAALVVPALGATLGKLVPALVLFTAAARFLLTGGYQLSAVPGLQTASGVVGLVVVVIGYYAALGLELEEVRGRPTLPLLRVGAGRVAMRGSLAEQVSGLEHEPGVREQL